MKEFAFFTHSAALRAAGQTPRRRRPTGEETFGRRKMLCATNKRRVGLQKRSIVVVSLSGRRRPRRVPGESTQRKKGKSHPEQRNLDRRAGKG